MQVRLGGFYDIYLSHFTLGNDFVDSVVSLIEESAINVYPNPATDFFNIDTDIDLKSVAIYNNSGKLVLESSNLNSQRVNIESLPKGLYVLMITDRDGNSYAGKLVH